MSSTDRLAIMVLPNVSPICVKASQAKKEETPMSEIPVHKKDAINAVVKKFEDHWTVTMYEIIDVARQRDEWTYAKGELTRALKDALDVMTQTSVNE